MWISHENYESFLENTWTYDNNLDASLKNFQANLTHWNRNIFGMVEKKKLEILARLNGIQRSRAYPHSQFLSELELELQRELDNLLRMEEIKWF
ncbi:hypothetical protein QN277_024006 [Acacia crassicarpa]|uniref:Uncharacterized protein n=1 Tax=Acacia crassicarpa TaxID=499986 RepID=A0AAE1MNK3_9FABA|nr:hypothetical protein QN277_024006 [Acacia crassicarpa]